MEREREQYSNIFYFSNLELNEKYNIIGRGSSRIVFAVDKEHVLKVPRSKRGIYQCRMEYEIYNKIDEELRKYLCPIVLYENERVLMKRADSLQRTEILHYNLSILDILDEQNRRMYKKDIKTIIRTYDLLYDDIARLSSWGIYKGMPVLIDYGCTNKIFNTYY